MDHFLIIITALILVILGSLVYLAILDNRRTKKETEAFCNDINDSFKAMVDRL